MLSGFSGGSGRWQTSGRDAAEPDLKGPQVGPLMPSFRLILSFGGVSPNYQDVDLSVYDCPVSPSSDDTWNPGSHGIDGASCTGNKIPSMLTAGKDHPECGG